MLISFVLRLRSEDLERGLIAGRIEHVASGRQQAISDLDGVASFCLDVAGDQPVIPGPRRLETPDEVEPA